MDNHVETVEIEDTEEKVKNTQLIEYFNNLKNNKKVTEVLIRFRSSMDIDVVLAVPDEKIAISKIMIESDFYLKSDLQADIVNRHREKILLLTKDKHTYEISVIGLSEFNKHYKIKE